MNCLYNCKMCRVCRYIRRHIKNFIIKALLVINFTSLLFWMCYLDAIISWQPYVIMLVNALVVGVIGYANDWFIDQEEGDD